MFSSNLWKKQEINIRKVDQSGRNSKNRRKFAPTPQLESLESRIQLSADFTQIAADLPTLLTNYGSAVQTQVLDKAVPVFGGNLGKVPEANVMGNLAATVGAGSDTSKIDKNSTAAQVAQDLQNDFSKLAGATVQVTVDNTGTGFNATIEGKTGPSATKIDFDPDLPNLGFVASGGNNAVTIESVQYNVHLHFGVDSSNNFFYDANPSNQLSLQVKADLQGAKPFSATLGLLNYMVADNGDTGFDGTYTANAGGGVLASNQISSITLNSPQLATNQSVNIDLHLSPPSNSQSYVPSLQANLVINNWSFVDPLQSGDPSTFNNTTTPTVTFNKISFDAGAFMTTLVNPVLNELQEVVAPFANIANELLSKPVDGLPFTYLDFFELIKAAADGELSLTDIPGLINFLSNFHNSDDFQFLEYVKDVGKILSDSAAVASDPISLPDVTISSNILTQAPSISTTSLPSEVGVLSGSTNDFYNEIKSFDGGSFSFDVLNNPASIYNLLLPANPNAQPTPLFSLDLPTLNFSYKKDFHYNTFIGPVPVTAGFDGSVDMTGNLGLGFDTTGLQEYISNHNPSSLLDGFYLTAPNNGSFFNLQMNIRAETGLGANISAQDMIADLGIELPPGTPLDNIGVVADLTAGPTITGNFNFAPSGPQFTGTKYYYQQVISAANSDLDCLLQPTPGSAINVTGQLIAEYGINFHTPPLKDPFGDTLIPGIDISPRKLPLGNTNSLTYTLSTDCGGDNTTGASQHQAAPPVPKITVDNETQIANNTWLVSEGDTVTLDARGSSPSNDPLEYTWSQIGNSPFPVSLSNTNGITTTFVPGDDLPAPSPLPSTPSGLVVRLIVRDEATGLSSSQDVTIYVKNLAPTIQSISSPAVGVRGQPVDFSANFTDPGSLNTFTGSWKFGDTGNAGDVSGVPTISPFIGSHAYTYSGNYTVTASITDDGKNPPGPLTTSANTQITIQPAALLPDPSDPSKTDLVVGGTPGNDAILLRRDPNSGGIEVQTGDFDQVFTAPTGDIAIYSYGGNDVITLDFSNGNFIPANGLLYDGGSGSNRLVTVGGSFTNVYSIPSGPTSGALVYDNSGLSYFNVQSVDELSKAANLTILTPSSAQTLSVSDGPSVNGLVTAVLTDFGTTFAPLDFGNKQNVTIQGGSGTTTFTLNNPHAATGLQSLTLNGNNAGNTFDILATTVPTTINTGSGINSINLQDASNSMAEITALLTINGKGGSNTLNASNDNSFTLTDSSLTSGTANVIFNSIQIANLAGGSGDDTFDVSNWSGSGSLDGQGGNNTVVATDDGDFTLTNTSLGRSNRGTLRLESLQNAQLTGGSGDHVFSVSNWSGAATLDGHGGNNTYNYVVGNGGTVHIVDSAKTGTDSAIITGSNSGDTFNITPSQFTDSLDAVTYDKNLDKLSVNGGSASDVFNVNPSAATTFVLDGGAPPPPTSPGDTLNLDLKGSAGAFRVATPTASGYQGSWTFANRQPVNFTHMETLTPALHLAGAGTPINGFEYSALNGTLAAKFTNADFLVPASDFVASIDWGDGTVTSGTITLSGNTYLIRGSHMYTDESIYTVKVTVSGDLTSAHFTTSATMLEQLLPDGTRGTPNQRFVSELFRDLLQRPVDQGSLNFWNNLLNLGLPQTFVVLGIESTPEYRQLQVQSLYQRYLHRQPNSFELTIGTDLLLAGATPEQLAMYLVSTPEFFFQQGAGSLTGYLSAFYHDALQSPILADVEMADMMQMAQGASLNDIVQEVLHQPDYQQGVVNDGILSLLDRNPTGTEASNLTLALEMGLTDDDVLALLATTTPYQEYFNKTAN